MSGTPINIFIDTKSSFDSHREWLISKELDYQWSHLEEGGYVIHVKNITKEQLKELKGIYFDT